MTIATLSGLPNPWVGEVTRYVLDTIRSAKPGSKFYERTAELRTLPETQWIPVLLSQKYDGLLLFDETRRIIGHAFIQRHSESIDLFAIEVLEPEKGQGHAKGLAVEFVKLAHRDGYRRAMFGAGGDEKALSLWRWLTGAHPEIPFALRKGTAAGELIIG